MEKDNKDKEKKKASFQGLDFDSLVGALNEEYGEGSAMSGNSGPVANVEAISSGSLALDLAIGINGWPRGRIIEIYGLESSGKTTTALHAIASAQKAGGNAVFIDAEHALDPEWAKIIGVDMNRLIVHQPDYGEQALDFACNCIESGAVDVIVIDSVAALIPKEELDGNIGDIQMGAMARMMSKAMRKMSALASKSKTSVIFLNQVRQKIGPMVFGNPNTTPGGNALKFYASVRVEVVKGGKISSSGSVVQRVESDTEVIGQEIKIKIVKNKVAAPFKTAIVHLMFDDKNEQYGFSPISELIDIGTDMEVIRRAGSNYYFDDGKKEIKLGAGRVAAIQMLSKDNDLFEKIKTITQAKMASMTRKFVVVDESELDTKIDKQLDGE